MNVGKNALIFSSYFFAIFKNLSEFTNFHLCNSYDELK